MRMTVPKLNLGVLGPRAWIEVFCGAAITMIPVAMGLNFHSLNSQDDLTLFLGTAKISLFFFVVCVATEAIKKSHPRVGEAGEMLLLGSGAVVLFHLVIIFTCKLVLLLPL